jgi:creatinine amidohydrolase
MTTDPRWASRTLEGIGGAAAEGAVAVLPVGATEQHGPHLATGADTFFAERVAIDAAAQTGDLVLPPLAYGCSLGHTDRWPGTISLHPRTLGAVVAEIGRWVHASGIRKLVIVNGHATNGPPCQSAVLELRHELPDFRLRFVSLFDLSPEIAARYAEDAPDFHANEAETSLMLHLEPDYVHPDRIVDEPDRTVGLVFQYPVPATTRSGVVGTPSSASAAGGEELHASLVEALVDLRTKARAEKDPALGPGQRPTP